MKLAACLLVSAAVASVAASAPPVRGELAMRQVTGAAVIRDDRLLLVSDTDGVALAEDAPARLPAGGALPAQPLSGLQGKVSLQDLEDVAWDGVGEAFVVTSHGRTPQGDAPEERYRLARLRFDATGKLLEARQTDALLQGLVNNVPFLGDSIRRTPARTGLNVGGLAWDPQGHLLVGLRAPTITESAPRSHGGQEDAVVVRIKNPDGIFESPPQPALLGDVVKLDLRGQGIHGMAYDPGLKQWWLLSGLSAEPSHAVQSPWMLWLWDGKGEARQAALAPGTELAQPEAVCPVEIGGKPHLLLIDRGATTSRYVVVPTPAVGPSK